MGRKHVWEGKLSTGNGEMSIKDDYGVSHEIRLELWRNGLEGKVVRIAVEVLETSGGATKEVDQHEEM